MRMCRAGAALFIFAVAGCSMLTGDGEVFTLYRSSVVDANLRVHVATFDAADGMAYNSENCMLAADLFNAQAGVKVRFFCEMGRFRAR